VKSIRLLSNYYVQYPSLLKITEVFQNIAAIQSHYPVLNIQEGLIPLSFFRAITDEKNHRYVFPAVRKSYFLSNSNEILDNGNNRISIY
jgi:hypothetical protein